MRTVSAAHDVLPAASNTGNADFELGLDENSVSPADQPGTHNDHLNRLNDENIISFYDRPIYNFIFTRFWYCLRIRRHHSHSQGHRPSAPAAEQRPSHGRHCYHCLRQLIFSLFRAKRGTPLPGKLFKAIFQRDTKNRHHGPQLASPAAHNLRRLKGFLTRFAGSE